MPRFVRHRITGKINDSTQTYDYIFVEERLKILTQLNQIDAGIYTVIEGLSEIVSPETGSQLLETTERRLNLDLGFL